MIEIRLHGRGGQGAVTASRIIASAAYEEGKYSQAIPMYGTERRGAPLTAFVRIDNVRVRERELVHTPDYSICLDPLLSMQQFVGQDVKPGGIILLNSPLKPENIPIQGPVKIATVDATDIALKNIGRPITNTAILGAFVKLCPEITMKGVEKAILKSFPGRIGEINIKAARASFDAVSEPIPATNQEAPKSKATGEGFGGYGILKDVSSWRVYTPSIDQNKCVSCKNCWIFCPENAIKWNDETMKPSLKNNTCKGCGICFNECPVKAIEMVRVEI